MMYWNWTKEGISIENIYRNKIEAIRKTTRKKKISRSAGSITEFY